METLGWLGFCVFLALWGYQHDLQKRRANWDRAAEKYREAWEYTDEGRALRALWDIERNGPVSRDEYPELNARREMAGYAREAALRAALGDRP